MEIQDILPMVLVDDNTARDDDPVDQFMKLAFQGFQKIGCVQPTPSSITDSLIRAGYANVQLEKMKIPIGMWPADRKMKTIGLMMRAAFLEAVHGLAAKPLAAMEIEPEERDEWIEKVRIGLDDNSIHRYLMYCVWTGQKTTNI